MKNTELSFQSNSSDNNNNNKTLYDNFYDYFENNDEDKENLENGENNDEFIDISTIKNTNKSQNNFSNISIFVTNEKDNKIDGKLIGKLIETIINKETLLGKTYFRFIPEKENKNMCQIFNSCHYIPLIKLEKDKILFHDGKENGQNLNLKELTDLIIINKLFIKNDENNNNDIINEGYICKFHKQNYCKFVLIAKLIFVINA